MIRIKQATNKGWIECREGGVADLSFPQSKTRRGRVQQNGDICPTITAGEGGLHRMSENVYRIRKLTPRECWRLMGFSTRDENGTWNDECFEKAEAVSSNTRLYKAAGNSIVVDCLYHILKNLPLDKEDKENRCSVCSTKIPHGWSICPICGTEISDEKLHSNNR